MAVRMFDVVFGVLPDLRVHPTAKRVRAEAGGRVVVDSRRVLIVWEPRRVVPSYAVPEDDVDGELVPFVGATGEESPVRLGADGPRVLDPSTPFQVHSCPGTPLSISTTAGELLGAAFAPDDPDLDGYVVLDWNAFDQWYEEDQPVTGHPHDPFDRIDCLRSDRHVVISAGGTVLADTRQATLLFETPLPTRYYIPREDVRLDRLAPSDHRSVCAYKGDATYWSVQVDGLELADVAWSYEQPLADAVPVSGMIAFFTERLDLRVDDVAVDRPVTPWS